MIEKMEGRLFSTVRKNCADEKYILYVFLPDGETDIEGERVDFCFPMSGWGSKRVKMSPPGIPSWDGAYSWQE